MKKGVMAGEEPSPPICVVGVAYTVHVYDFAIVLYVLRHTMLQNQDAKFVLKRRLVTCIANRIT